ncbi:MAG: hypothetical protein ACRD4U_02480 [Candidatus Acidiferrales bacterium]
MAEAKAETVPLGERLRRAGLFILFGLVLLIPKTLGLRRRRDLWNVLRLMAGVVGAVLLFDKLGGLWSALAGLLLLLFALFVRPVKEGKTADDQARELGALIVLNGGRLRQAGGDVVRFFLTPVSLHALDLKHRDRLVIPLASVRAVWAEEARDGWRLRIEWEGGEAESDYDGFFAEHLARVAETTLRSQLRRELPVLRSG